MEVQRPRPTFTSVAGSKVKKWGIKTFDDILDEAEKAGDLSAVATHIGTVVETLGQSEHPFAPAASSRILLYYQKACRAFNNQPAPTLFYLKQCRSLKVGRRSGVRIRCGDWRTQWREGTKKSQAPPKPRSTYTSAGMRGWSRRQCRRITQARASERGWPSPASQVRCDEGRAK